MIVALSMMMFLSGTIVSTITTGSHRRERDGSHRENARVLPGMNDATDPVATGMNAVIGTGMNDATTALQTRRAGGPY